MEGVAREFAKLEKKQINKPLLASVDRITVLLEETKRRIENGLSFPPDIGHETFRPVAP
jgi:hypothetical protein